MHATDARQRALQHWDFGTSRIIFSPHIQTKNFQQRPPLEKSLKLASCHTRPVASLFWQPFCSYPKCISWGGENVWGGGHFGGGRGKCMVEKLRSLALLAQLERGGGVNVWSKEEKGETCQNFGLRKSTKWSHPEPTTIFNHCLHRTLFCPWVAVVTSSPVARRIRHWFAQ